MSGPRATGPEPGNGADDRSADRRPLVAVLSDGFAAAPQCRDGAALRVERRELGPADTPDARDRAWLERLRPALLWLDLEPERVPDAVTVLCPSGLALAFAPPMTATATAAEQVLARLRELGARALVAHRLVHLPGLARIAALAKREPFIDWRGLELELGGPAATRFDDAPWTTRGHHAVVGLLTDVLGWLEALSIDPARMVLRPDRAATSIEPVWLEARSANGRRVRVRLGSPGGRGRGYEVPPERARLVGDGWALSWQGSGTRERVAFAAGKQRSERSFERASEPEHIATVLLRLLEDGACPPAPIERHPGLLARATELGHALLYDQNQARAHARRVALAREASARGAPWRELTVLAATRSIHEPSLLADRASSRELCPPLTRPFRLLLVRAPLQTDTDRSFPPLGMAQLGAAAGSVGAEVTMLDCAPGWDVPPSDRPEGGPPAEASPLPPLLAASRYDLVGLSLGARTAWPAVEQRLLPALRRLETPIVVGGPEAAPKLRGAAPTWPVDYLIAGEGELGLVGLMHALQGTRDLGEVPGLWDAAHPERAPRPIVLPDFALLPTPDFGDLDLGRYRHRSPSLGHPFLPYQPLRGCRHGCTFCADESARRIRARPVEHVVRDLRTLRDRYGVRNFYLLDNLVNADEHHLDALLDGLLDAELDICWCDCARPARLDRERLRRMRRAGCVELVFGVDTASPRLLRLVRKGFTVEQAEHTLRLASEEGIAPVVNLIVGMPHETEQDFRATVAFVERTRGFVRQFFPMAYNYTAGSPLFNEPGRFGLRRCGPRFDVVDGPSWQEHRAIRQQRHQHLCREVLGYRQPGRIE